MITATRGLTTKMGVAMPRVMFNKQVDAGGASGRARTSLSSQAAGIVRLLHNNTDGLERLTTLPKASVLQMLDERLVTAGQIADGANELVQWLDGMRFRADHGQYAHYREYKGLVSAGHSPEALKRARELDVPGHLKLLGRVADVLEERPEILAAVIDEGHAAVAAYMMKDCVLDHYDLQKLARKLSSSAGNKSH